MLLDDDEGPVPGILSRGTSGPAPREEPLTDLDALPMPDFDDYFAQVRLAALPEGAEPHVVEETSRGC